MYKNNSTTDTFPKTLLIRNTEGGMIWQIYHVNSEKVAQVLAANATLNKFEAITLEDYNPEYEETWPDWRETATIDVKLLENKGNNLPLLLKDGHITIEEVLTYAQNYMDAMDQYDDEQIDKYGSELDYGMTEEERMFEEMRMLDEMYGDDLIEPTPEDLRSPNPQYIVVSTVYKVEETYVFEANENGEITNLSEYGGIALRFGDVDWTDHNLAVKQTFGEGKYQFIERLKTPEDKVHCLFKRIDNHYEQEYPLPSDTWDGGVVQEP